MFLLSDPRHCFISLCLLLSFFQDKLQSRGNFSWTPFVLKCMIHKQAVTINANAWSDAGHAVNHLYDILYMMGRDDIPVGVGGDGGISNSGTIHPNVGGYLPLIDQV